MTDLAGQLEDTKCKLHRPERKREKLQLAQHDELSAGVGKPGRVRKKHKAVKLSCVVCASARRVRDARDKHCDEEIQLQGLWDASGTTAFNRFKCNLRTSDYVIAHYLFAALCILYILYRIYHLVSVLGGTASSQGKMPSSNLGLPFVS